MMMNRRGSSSVGSGQYSVGSKKLRIKNVELRNKKLAVAVGSKQV